MSGMDTSGEVPGDAAAVPAKNGAGVVTMSSGNGRGKVRLLTRDALDRRTVASREYDRLVAHIRDDISAGGKHQLSAIQLTLIDAYVGEALIVRSNNIRIRLGQDVDADRHYQALGAMARIAPRLGVHRRSPDEGPSLGEYLQTKQINAEAQTEAEM
jgi:hypothetical protein